MHTAYPQLVGLGSYAPGRGLGTVKGMIEERVHRHKSGRLLPARNPLPYVSTVTSSTVMAALL
jgi:hypothetical protein